MFQTVKRYLNQDPLLQRVARNTGYLFGSNSITMVLSMVQSIFAARLLGIFDFGVLGTITVFATTVNRLFSFRMGEVVVKYLGDFLEENRLDRAATVMKTSFLVEATSSILGHTRPDTTIKIYQHISRDLMKDVVNKIPRL